MKNTAEIVKEIALTNMQVTIIQDLMQVHS
nr:MAG TPA: hypothetical protein [Caudoviricetes sp.]DAL46708.1 MAG TPA_asm: hypothetical protein [Bacteriophage sp.]